MALRIGRLALIMVGALVALLLVLWAAFRVPDIPVATLRAKYGSPASQYVALAPGTVIHLRDEGVRDGVPVVLLHGSNASVHTWEPWVARLKTRYRVISFDFPGHGLSGPVPSRDYSTAAYVGVTQAVVDHLGLKRFVLAGNSMGGGVAWHYAAIHPERVAALVLVDAAGQPDPGSSSPPLGFRIARTPGLRAIAASITPRWLISQSIPAAFTDKSLVTPAMIDRYWELLRFPGNRAATLDRFAGYHSVDDGALLAKITAPTLILWGRDDQLIPVSSAAWFAQRLPKARVVILDHVGHVPMEEAPDRALAPVTALLDGIAADPATPPPAK